MLGVPAVIEGRLLDRRGMRRGGGGGGAVLHNVAFPVQQQIDSRKTLKPTA